MKENRCFGNKLKRFPETFNKGVGVGRISFAEPDTYAQPRRG
jgi:hypothetical protein